ncbi:hypothetical protein FIBSPDRAFT_961982 [Athelia psychrophila]|uniref:Uncharacterized protein n=1 Tax=Athelia psychrophila TaxID=1759441 RepID=A0A166AP97_9AGAM|nr:hypothetical protein FIBSPDRAFT_961982 [Fibularhizoctonia sp. CBS 109695]
MNPRLRSPALTVLNGWRSIIGKEGLAAVDDLFREEGIEIEERQYDTPEKRKAFVKNQLDPSKFDFIYRDPDNETGKGIFQAELILSVFAYHLKSTAGSRMDYGRPSGALGLATAAVERALSFWKTGHFDDTDHAGDKGKKVNLNAESDNSRASKNRTKRRAFNEAFCGGHARTWASKATLMTDERWDAIIGDALWFVTNVGDDDDDDSDFDVDQGDQDPRNNVIFDW